MIVNRMPVLAIWIALGASCGTGVTVSFRCPAIQGTASVIGGDTIERLYCSNGKGRISFQFSR